MVNTYARISCWTNCWTTRRRVGTMESMLYISQLDHNQCLFQLATYVNICWHDRPGMCRHHVYIHMGVHIRIRMIENIFMRAVSTSTPLISPELSSTSSHHPGLPPQCKQVRLPYIFLVRYLCFGLVYDCIFFALRDYRPLVYVHVAAVSPRPCLLSCRAILNLNLVL